MTEALELRKLAKQLQATSSAEVKQISFNFPTNNPSLLFRNRPELTGPSFTHVLQETIDILQILKKDAVVTEAILRVSAYISCTLMSC